MLKKIAKVMIGAGETKFTCKRCGKEWYVSVKEIKEQQKLKEETNKHIATANLGKAFSMSPSKHSKINAEVAQMKATQKMREDYDRCPECGSKSVEREFVE